MYSLFPTCSHLLFQRFSFQSFPSLDPVFHHSLLAFSFLSFLERRSSVQNPADDCPGVDVLERVVADLVEESQRFGGGVGVEGKWDEGRGPVVEAGYWAGEGEGGEE